MATKSKTRSPATPKTEGESPLGQGAPDARQLQRSCDIAVAGIALVMLIIVCSLSTMHVLWPDDQYTDMNTLMSGENFSEHGLFRLRMLPVFHLGEMTDPPSYYTHYPPFTNLVNGLLHIVGVESVAAIRIFCGLVGIVGLVCMYRAFAPDIGPLAAACGLGFLGTTGFFFTYCISLHHTFNFFFMGVFFLLFTHAVRSDRPATKAWIGCWIVLMLEALTSFEFIIYPQVFAWVYVLATGRLRRCWRPLIVLATAPVAGVGLHFLQNCWALGWSAAVTDAADAFRRPGRGFEQDRWAVLTDRVPEFVLSHSRRLYYWPWPVLPIVAVVWLALTGREQDGAATIRRAGAMLLAALAGSVTWYFFMPVHTIKHPHTMSQLLPLIVIVMGGGVGVMVRWLYQRGVPVHGRVLAVVALLVVVFGQKRSIGQCFERASKRPESFYLFEAMGGNAFPPNAAVLTNTYADAQLAYFIRRPLWRSPTPVLPFTPESLASLQGRLPPGWSVQYYIFDSNLSGIDRTTFELLAKNCPGRLLVLPIERPRQALAVFDIRPLFAPSDQRRPLPAEIQQRQLKWQFPRWDPPNFARRLQEVLSQHGKL